MDDIAPRLDQLAVDVDGLEAALAPLLLNAHGMADAAQRLPLLDKAKLHVLAAYALESVLYGSLGLAGVDARQHAVYRELLRVRQYMDKIAAAENPPPPPKSRLDKAAAIRFVKNDMDDPAVKAQLNKLVKEEVAAAVTAVTAAAKNSSDATTSRGRSNLTKRPKHGSNTSGSHRGHPYARGHRPA